MGNTNPQLIEYERIYKNDERYYFSNKEKVELKKKYYKDKEFEYKPKKFESLRYILSDTENDIHIGEGAFGKIIKKTLRDKNGPLNCAIKIFKVKEDESKRIQNEINILKMCNHDNIIKFYGEHSFKNDKENKALFFEAAELNLKQHMKNQVDGKLPVSIVKKYAYQILMALEYLHFKNILHNDIKPENIMISSKGDIKLIDFGISVKIKKPVNSTEMYLPPEFSLDRRYNYLGKDIYTFGVTIYELLGGDITKLNKIKLFNFNKKNYHADFQLKNCDDITNDFIKSCLEIDPFLRKKASHLLKHPFLESISNDQYNVYSSVYTKHIEQVREKEKGKSFKKNENQFLIGQKDYEFNKYFPNDEISSNESFLINKNSHNKSVRKDDLIQYLKICRDDEIDEIIKTIKNLKPKDCESEKSIIKLENCDLVNKPSLHFDIIISERDIKLNFLNSLINTQNPSFPSLTQIIKHRSETDKKKIDEINISKIEEDLLSKHMEKKDLNSTKEEDIKKSMKTKKLNFSFLYKVKSHVTKHRSHI